ncbi:HDIG domain-containing metalloprotein [Promicromonospora sp. NPDC052451]|uniref:HDIG domain-containing metalloprotein n=1 Tax=unclassified Promicromonospora TaxID=2647929 RepID=UPI0037C5D79F
MSLFTRRAVDDAALYGEPMQGTTPREIDPAGAQALLSELFDPGADRLAHSLGVGRRAEHVARVLGRPSLLVTAAYLHDVGYAAAARDTGLHQLDGARYLRSLGASAELTGLVAHHTSATVEAAERGLDVTLRREFPAPSGELLDLLTYCDITTSARGETVTVDERFEHIYDRYPPGHLVSRSMQHAEPGLRQMVSRIERQLDRPAR